LMGITYDLLTRLAKDGALELEVRRICEAELRAADEIWLSSSSKEVLAVTKLDGRPVGTGKPGPLFRRIHSLYQDYKSRLAAGRAVAA